jgi:hypothetical protein
MQHETRASELALVCLFLAPTENTPFAVIIIIIIIRTEGEKGYQTRVFRVS